MKYEKSKSQVEFVVARVHSANLLPNISQELNNQVVQVGRCWHSVLTSIVCITKFVRE